MPHLAPLIQDLAIILAVAAGVTLLFQKIHQPVVLGYILAGILIGPFTPPFMLVEDLPNIQTLAELGVIFLMFSLGLEFSFRKLTQIGLSIGITAAWEITLMVLIGYACGQLLGWTPIESLFLGCMISISSTTIIVKALEELGLKTRHSSKMIFGVLIVEDLVVILMLAILSGFVTQGGLTGREVLISTGKLITVLGSWIIFGYFLVPHIVRYVGRFATTELLTILSVALCLLLVTLSAYLGYSVALGAFMMGSILAETIEVKRIQNLIRPLRDVFVAVFFVSVGMLIDPTLIYSDWLPLVVITVTLVGGKIINITLGSLLTGQTLNNSLHAGFGMAQIGEFSFVLATLGLSLGVIGDHIYPLIVVVSIITTFMTPYLMKLSSRMADVFENRLHKSAKHSIFKYQTWLQKIDADTHHRKVIFKNLLRWFANGIVIIVAFVLAAHFALPWLMEKFEHAAVAKYLTWVIAIFFSAPFIWGMFSTFSRLKLEGLSKESNETLKMWATFLTRLLTLLWIGLLSIEFFTFWTSLLVVSLMAFILFALFYRQLETSYEWIESHFLSTFKHNNHHQEDRKKQFLKHLAPWDVHLFGFHVHPNSKIAGKELKELDFYQILGTKVVVIQRGLKTMIDPDSTEIVYPHDELLLLGTDTQLEQAGQLIEEPESKDQQKVDLSQYHLKKVLVNENSPLVDTTIRDVKFKKQHIGMIIGIERGNDRIITPGSDTKIKAGDMLFIMTKHR